MLKFKKVIFLKSCTKPDQFPQYPYPEFAFIGRSNVGKSSLINMITSHKNLVKTGARPGVTKTINYFIADDRISFADLPGYGYAALPVELKKTFLPMVKSYIKSRENLRLAFLLIDIRRVPDSFEHDMIKYLIEHDIRIAITLTKCDKLSNNQKQKHMTIITEALGVDADSVFFTSSKSGAGKKELLELIDEFSKISVES